MRRDMHPEERRFAAVVGELIVQRSLTVEEVERRLGWRDGRLAAALDEQRGLELEELLEVLRMLETTPADFFAQLAGHAGSPAAGRNGLFEESRKVIRAAIARKAAGRTGDLNRD